MNEREEQFREIASHLPIFFGTDQPETCRNCGGRTDFENVADQKQTHQCGHYGTQYLLEFDH